MPLLAIVLSSVLPCTVAMLVAKPATAHTNGSADLNVGAEETTATYVVVLPGTVADAAAATGRLEREGGFQAGLRYSAAIKGFAASLSPAQAERLRNDPDVDYLAPDKLFRASALTAVASKETVPAGVRRVRAATLTEAHTASNVAAAVLDTGLDLANGDLNAASGTNCIKPGTAAKDDHGHGTHVAGTLAGRNTGAGVVGVAPGTKLYAVKVLSAKGTGTLSQIVCGIDWVTANAAALNIKVVNMSLNGSGANDGNCGQTNADPEHRAICASVAKGLTYTVSAGNSQKDFATSIPAAYPEVLTVTAMTDTDGKPDGVGPAPCTEGEKDESFWTSSSYAVASTEAQHTIAAPGTCVVSTKRGGGTAMMSGTSMAAPHVAGAVALCLGNGGTAGPCTGKAPAQVMEQVREDAAGAAQDGFGFDGDPFRPAFGKHFGHLVSAASY